MHYDIARGPQDSYAVCSRGGSMSSLPISIRLAIILT